MGTEGIGKEGEQGLREYVAVRPPVRGPRKSARPVRASHPGRLLYFQTFFFGRSIRHQAPGPTDRRSRARRPLLSPLREPPRRCAVVGALGRAQAATCGRVFAMSITRGVPWMRTWWRELSIKLENLALAYMESYKINDITT